ncbi:hypothetical protein HUU59_05365 [bacterium]|nr:hypothetical protein [bacterium]
MTKKWLMYVVTGILCCGMIGFAVAKQTGRNKQMTERDRAKMELLQVEQSMLKYGETPELAAKKAELNVKLGLDRGAVQDLLSPQAPAGYEAPATEAPVVQEAVVQESPFNKDRIAAALEALEAGRDLSLADKQMLEAYWAMQVTEVRYENRLDDQGGPSPFGYRWVDNLAGDTATYAWEEPTAPIELPISSSDDAAASVPFGFNFPFYGTTYTSANASTNGVIAFVTTYTSWSNPCPSMTFANPMILPYHDDGNTNTGASSDGGRVVYQQYADHVTITWDSVGTCCTNGTDLLDYQVQLWNDGKIKFQYRQIQAVVADANTNGSSPLIGIHRTTGGDFLNYHCSTVMDSAYTNALDGRAVWFYLGQGLTHDFAATSLISPAPLQVSPNAVLNIVAQFTNFGTTTESAPVKYRFNGGPINTENTAALAQFATENHDWAGTETAPGVVGDYELLIYSDLATDENRSNDTIRVQVLVRECADFSVTAPGVWNGTTVGAGDDCNIRTGLDHIYEVVIPTTGLWTFTLCGSTFDTYLYLTSACCSGVLAQNDDSECNGVFTLQSTISCFQLDAGTYFVNVEPWSGGSGAYTLEVTQAGCSAARCCYFDGISTQCVDNTLAQCNALGGEWTEGLSCATDPCVTGACCYSTGICADVTSSYCAILGGTYEGDGTLCANTECVNPCELDCGAFDILEVAEFDTCNNDTIDANGGCNNVGPRLFQDIQCGDTICGRSFTYDNCVGLDYRDTDWYEFTLTDTQNVTWSVIAEFDGVLGFIIGGPCEALTILGQAGPAAGCGQVVTTTVLCLPPGTYWTWVGPTVFGAGALPYSGNFQYRAWLDCTPCVPPTGRCCYDGGLSCINTTFGECELLGGVWDEFLTCETDPCAIQPPNDDCGTALEIVVVPNGTATANVANEGATNSCTGTCTDDCGTWVSTSPDQFFYFTLTECRLIAVMADPNDPHIEVYEDGQCCGTPILCNDDWGCNPDLDFYAWLPPALRPTANFGSMVADTLPAGTYYIRAGEWGAGWNGDYVLSVIDFGPCEIAPCDPIVDLAIYAATVGSIADHIELFFTAPQDDDYKIWSTSNPNNDGDPNDGADPDWTLVATLPGLLAGPQTWVAPAGFSNYLNYVVTAVCEPFQAPVGRCCYGDFQCADITEAECNDLGGFWTQFANCANDPCPPPPPANDDCGNAIEVFNGVPLQGSTDGAFIGVDVTTCTFDDLYDVWYVYNAPNTNPITATTCEATFYYDTGISAWSACGGTELACNDDNCVSNGLQSTITFSPSAPGPVYIRVSGYNSQVGTFTLSVTQ